MLHLDTVSPECFYLIKELLQIPALASFRLAGGTALALQKGHRISIDADFFAAQPFNHSLVVQAIESYLYPNKPSDVRTYPFGFFCSINDIKTDFMYWGDAFIDEAIQIDGIRMTTPLEIFAMKLNAVTSRKAKKDFIDISLLLQTISLSSALDAFKKKYPYNDIASVLKSLVYFEEAEKDADPKMLLPLSWDSAKEKITEAVRQYWQSYTA